MTSRPYIFVTSKKIDGLRSVDELRESIRWGHSQSLWHTIRGKADTDCKNAPLTSASDIPGREAIQIRHANPDWTIVNAAGQRVQQAAIAALITGKTKYRDSALRQMNVLFDRDIWPHWRDQAPSHQKYDADLRTGMLSITSVHRTVVYRSRKTSIPNRSCTKTRCQTCILGACSVSQNDRAQPR
jgi:hypothetical protein